MKEYTYAKLIGVIACILTILGAIGFGILSFIGMGLSKAFNTHNDTSMNQEAIIVVILLLLACITGIGPYRLHNKAWRIFYTGFCLVLGVGLIVTFILSIGSIGFKNEIFIVCVGTVYLFMGYLVIKKK